LSKQWCIPPKANAEFVWKMEDVLEVYKRPYDPQRPVVCLDETSKQLIGETRTPVPPAPGQVAHYDCEYVRNGVANIFMIFEPLAGQRDVEVTDRRTKKDYAECLRKLSDEMYPDAEVIVLVQDNLNTHTPASLYEAFEPTQAKRLAERFECHYTPKHGSWLDMAEIELGILGRQCLSQRIDNIEDLRRQTKAWEKSRDQAAVKVNWQFTPEDARIKLRRLYPSVEE
jgi:DDE superfamily endonuclease